MKEFDEIEDKHKLVIGKAIEIMKKVNDPKHSIIHTQDVVSYAQEILNNEKDADKEITIVASYWHDVGRSIQSEGHSVISANMLKEELEKENYDSNFIEKCYLAICKHGWYDMPETLEGIIVRDADKIDFVGVNRWKNCIKNNCKFDDILKLLPTLRSKILQLESSKLIYDKEVAKLIGCLHAEIFK